MKLIYFCYTVTLNFVEVILSQTFPQNFYIYFQILMVGWTLAFYWLLDTAFPSVGWRLATHWLGERWLAIGWLDTGFSLVGWTLAPRWIVGRCHRLGVTYNSLGISLTKREVSIECLEL